LSGLVKQNTNGKQQTLADLFKELVAGANGSKKKPDGNPGKNSDIQAMPSEIRTNVQTVNYLGRHGVSNLTARYRIYSRISRIEKIIPKICPKFGKLKFFILLKS
jgi:hypothetical protein